MPLIALATLSVLGVAYLAYGRFLARHLQIDDAQPTPAHTRADGHDFVATRPFYLLGQHFSAIAAAGPIAGPIIACQQFGWLPCLLWICFGVVFVGAVHDFSTLVASIRHQGRSIAEIVRIELGRRAWLAMMAFIWLALVYVILAFTDITASTFIGRTDELAGFDAGFNLGGAVAFSSILYLVLSLVMGLVERFVRPPLWLSTVVFVPATLVIVWLGTRFSTIFLLDAWTWGVLILAYCFVASLLPVWSLLQPRGYLGGFVLYIALAVGLVGVFFGGFEIKQQAFRTWDAGGATGSLFPFLFVTIACGACSGFHGLVCSGTTSKQIDKESHCQPVGYGAMLLEAFVALIALSTVMIVAPADVVGKGPGVVYGQGMGTYLCLVIGRGQLLFATTFGAMAFSTFVFDTLDVATRLGRYIIQELLGWEDRGGGLVATGLTVGLPLLLLRAGGEGAYRSFWVLFGTSNQLLAALSLLGVAVWLRRSQRSVKWTVAPMAFVLVITVWSLLLQAAGAVRAWSAGGPRFDAATANGVVAIALLALAAVLVREALRSARRVRPA